LAGSDQLGLDEAPVQVKLAPSAAAGVAASANNPATSKARNSS
jgi:hypothetical protein